MLKRALLSAAASLAISGAAYAGPLYYAFPRAASLSGNEVIGPILQNGQNVTATVGQIAGAATSGSNLTPATVNINAGTGVSCTDAGQNGTTLTNTAAICAHHTVQASEAGLSNATALTAMIDNSVNVVPSVAGFFYGNSHAGASEVWALNPVLNLFPGSTVGGVVNEEDLNNWSCDPGNLENLSSTCTIGAVGTLYQGASPYPSQSAIAISGVSTGNAQWHQGISAVGLHVVDFSTFYQNDGALYGYRDVGAHGQAMISLGGGSSNPALQVYSSSPGAVDLYSSTNSQFAVRMPDGATNTDILWPIGGGTIDGDGSGGVKIAGTTGNLTVKGGINAAGVAATGNVIAGPGEAFITRDNGGPNGASESAGYITPNGSGGLAVGSLRSGALPVIDAANTQRMLNVCNLGAACDGNTDDTAVIQQYITSGAGNATILIPFGKVTRTSGLTLPSSTSLRVEGEIELTPASDKSVLSAVSATGITIYGQGTIDGDASSFTSTPAYPVACINFQSSTTLYVRGQGGYLHLQNCQSFPINAWTPNGTNPIANNNVNISYVEASNSGHSVECANVNGCYVDHLNVHGIGDYGFSFYGGVNDGSIVDSKAWNNSAGGISLLDDSGESAADQNITVAHNHMYSNYASGLSISNSNGSYPQHQHVIVDGNVSYGNNTGNGGNYGGYFIYGCNHCTVSNNVSHGNDPGGSAATAGFYSNGNSYTTFQTDTSYDEGGGLGYGFAGSTGDIHDAFYGDRVFDDQQTATTAYGFIGALTATSVAQGNSVGSTIGAPFNWSVASGALDCHDIEGVGYVSCNMQQTQATPIVANATSSATLAATNCGQTFEDSSSASVTYTVPTGLPAGCRFSVMQMGSGTITLAAGSGMTGLGTLVTSTSTPRLDMQIGNPATAFVAK